MNQGHVSWSPDFKCSERLFTAVGNREQRLIALLEFSLYAFEKYVNAPETREIRDKCKAMGISLKPAGGQMTRERAKRLLPIIQAFADDKAIEARAPNDQQWSVVTSIANFDADAEWRIKPEPREWWLVIWRAGASSPCIALFNSKAEAENYSAPSSKSEIVCAREVIP